MKLRAILLAAALAGGIGSQAQAANFLRFTVYGSGEATYTDLNALDPSPTGPFKTYFTASFAVDVEPNDPNTQNPSYYSDGHYFTAFLTPGVFGASFDGNGAGANQIINDTKSGQIASVGFSQNYPKASVSELTSGTAEGSASLFQYGGSSIVEFGGTVNRYEVSQAGGFELLGISLSIAPVPEPLGWVTMIVGFGAMGAQMRLRRRNVSVRYA